MNFKQLTLGLLTVFLTFSCGSDDSGNTPDEQTLNEQQQETLETLTNNSLSQTWKISNASLTNNNGTFDISNNSNTQDDEFIFSSDGSMQWRPGHDINREASSTVDALLDHYLSTSTSNYNFVANSGNELTSLNGSFSFTVVDEDTITGVLTWSTGESLTITLTLKLDGDYPSPPESGLNFSELFTYDSNNVSCCAPGMIGSYSANSLYIVTREDRLADTGTGPERIVKYNLETGEETEQTFDNPDFVSKQLHIIDNELIVIGGQFVNTYNLDLNQTPESTTHGLAITRFGMAVVGDDAYITGGDLDQDGDQNIEAEKIYKWNIPSQSLEYVVDLPEDRFGARTTIVNDKLYAFGGTTEFATNGQGNSSIYIYDINTGSTTTEQMTTPADYTYVDKLENLIYVAGYYTILDSEGNATDIEFKIGVYDTENGTYQEIDNNLSQEGYNSIRGMCVFNDKMYVLYGLFDAELPEIAEWKIMVADLN